MGGDSCTSTPAPPSPLTPVRLVFTSCKSLSCSQYNPRKIPHTQLTLALFLDGCWEHAHVWRGWWGWQWSLVTKTQNQSVKGVSYTGLGSGHRTVNLCTSDFPWLSRHWFTNSINKCLSTVFLDFLPAFDKHCNASHV